MFTSEMLRLFPRRRIKPIDGMAVTAEVWDEAHEYHRQLSRFHALLMHGAGLVTGLKVIASEPADNSVYILPGIALDSIGQTIVLPEPRAYDIGNSVGLLYLVVSYNESRPQVAGGQADEDAPRYVHEQFLLEAVTQLPQTPHVELARIRRRDREGPIVNAVAPEHPRANEIDLRFRHEIGVQEQQPVSVGVLKLTDSDDETQHAEGMENVALYLQRHSGRPVWVDVHAGFDTFLDDFDLLYVVGSGQFTLDAEQMNILYSFLQGGGVIFYESCRRDTEQGDPSGDDVFRDSLASMGVELKVVDRKHALMRKPHLFGLLPDGFETRGSRKLEAGGGVIFSTFDFGCVWACERRGRPAARSEIRNAFEWAENLLDFAAERRNSHLQQNGESAQAESNGGRGAMSGRESR